MLRIVVISLLIGALLGCQSEPEAVLIDVDTLANQRPHYVDSILGVPTEITSITKYPSMMPGEFRYYTLADGTTANVQFYKGQAKLFSITFSNPLTSPISLANRCGFEITELGGLKKTVNSRTWTRVQTTYARYKRVTAAQNAGGKFAVLQAEVY
jgi:hypothetical protein